MATKDFTGKKFVMVREFDAPRELVFKAWTDPKHLAQWWGPRGFTNPVCEWDVRPGGKIYDVMRAPNKQDYPMGGEFREVVPPEKVSFVCGPLNEKGEMIFEFLHTVVLTEKNGKTKMTLSSQVLKTTPGANQYISGFEAGMGSSLDRLEKLIVETKALLLVVERTIDAPVARVWQAMKTKDEMSRWFFDLKEFKARVGFEFDFAVEHEGNKYHHRCKVTEAVPQKKLAFTWRYQGHEGDSLVTFELAAKGEKTKLTLTHSGLETFPKTPQFARKNFEGGWNFISTGLKEFAENVDKEIYISREFDAPRELLWEAMTNPKHVGNWWGPQGFTTTIEKMDFRVGGVWKHVMRGPDGAEYPNQSIFKEIVKPEKVVFSHGGHKKGGPGVSFISTWTFDALGKNKSRVSIHMVFPSTEKRDFVVKEFGAIEGAKQTLERLAGYAVGMKKK
ncbi:MAG TPA: SRPBCC domain-containing protein [Pseudomonadales bacterium]|nr:SRPBCC domain-containing protein [Pseudomonadales bacterium]